MHQYDSRVVIYDHKVLYKIGHWGSSDESALSLLAVQLKLILIANHSNNFIARLSYQIIITQLGAILK